jgi:hypothetical protein
MEITLLHIGRVWLKSSGLGFLMRLEWSLKDQPFALCN